MTRDKYKQRITEQLQLINPSTDYYCITLLGKNDGILEHAVYSHWVGYTDESHKTEIRRASIINATAIAQFWQDIGQSYLVINDTEGLVLFLRFGGNALVAKEIGEKYLSDIIAPHEVTYDGPMGFKAINDIPNHAFKKAARPKQRMRIMKRDKHRCRICGRRPDDYTDIELHVHHIRPWGRGGLTEDCNLITLCDTCHDGIDPHEDHALFHLLDPERWAINSKEFQREYLEGVSRYREIVRNMLINLDKDNLEEE